MAETAAKLSATLAASQPTILVFVTSLNGHTKCDSVLVKRVGAHQDVRVRRMASLIPTEDAEQAAFVQWLRLKRLPHFHVPNSTYTKSWKQKAKNKALGVVPGVPDIFVVVGGKLVAVEMKRTKGGVVSASQIEWLKTLESAGVAGRVCKGADEAIKFIEEQNYATN